MVCVVLLFSLFILLSFGVTLFRPLFVPLILFLSCSSPVILTWDQSPESFQIKVHTWRGREREKLARDTSSRLLPLFSSLFSLLSISPLTLLWFCPSFLFPAFLLSKISGRATFTFTQLISLPSCSAYSSSCCLSFPLSPSYHLSFNTIESLIHSNGLLSTWTGFKRRRRFIVSPIFSFILSFSRLVPCIFRYRLLSFQILTTGVHEGREEEEKVRTKSKYDSSIIGSKRKDVYKTQRPEWQSPKTPASLSLSSCWCWQDFAVFVFCWCWSMMKVIKKYIPWNRLLVGVLLILMMMMIVSSDVFVGKKEGREWRRNNK